MSSIGEQTRSRAYGEAKIALEIRLASAVMQREVVNAKEFAKMRQGEFYEDVLRERELAVKRIVMLGDAIAQLNPGYNPDDKEFNWVREYENSVLQLEERGLARKYRHSDLLAPDNVYFQIEAYEAYAESRIVSPPIAETVDPTTPLGNAALILSGAVKLVET